MGAKRQATVDFAAAHARVRRKYGKASEHMCKCGSVALHWAFQWRTTPRQRWLLGKSPNARTTTPAMYSLLEEDYQAMCAQCAYWYDKDERVRAFVFAQ